MADFRVWIYSLQLREVFMQYSCALCLQNNWILIVRQVNLAHLYSGTTKHIKRRAEGMQI